MDLGFRNAGFETLLAIDLCKVSCATLEKNKVATKIICDDIKNINFKSYNKKVDGIIGGPPCQPYSQTRHYLIEKKNGFDDEANGFTVPQFLRVLSEVKPYFFLFENVDGFAYKTHNLELNYFLKSTKELGYKNHFKVINTADFGIPQTRKRFVCVGIKDKSNNFKFPTETHSSERNLFSKLKPWVTCKDTISEFDYITNSESLNTPGGKDKELFKLVPPGDNYLFFTKKRGNKNPKFKWKSRYWTFLLKLSPHRPSWTIQASFSKNQGPFHWKNRFLRIEEIKRLQTIDDNYSIEGSFKEKWKQIGNAFPTKMSEIIAEKIKSSFCT